MHSFFECIAFLYIPLIMPAITRLTSSVKLNTHESYFDVSCGCLKKNEIKKALKFFNARIVSYWFITQR